MAEIIIDRPTIGGGRRLNSDLASELFEGVARALDELGDMESHIESITVGPEPDGGSGVPTSFCVTIIIADNPPESGLFGRVVDDSKVQIVDGEDNLYRHILDRVQKLVENTKYRLEQRLGILTGLLARLKGDEGLPGVLSCEELECGDILTGVEHLKSSPPTMFPPFVPECPNCSKCGQRTVPDGGGYKCLNCGESVGTT